MSELKFREPNYEKGRRECARRKEDIESFREYARKDKRPSYEAMERPFDI